ncbi:cilia- and flagella-associated protein 36 isoform X1 [Takifugu flavidus]|uniref:cilia- and flagella-associated protein 36 isoform X1 n=1 Tax=Takifugu flavidus TaxID=433684 RepID=UPI00254402A8|nr:cilia- and flagella-associated protein 36 isoform X1 [Takifugu flavidus]XP_056903057.1 cilia- and flagella-associated protein 36 isoform X1 [Takifugu flavidus]
MAEDDREWVFESIVGYLSSPIWLIPINEFLETKSLVFDDEEENKLSYTDIHMQYKTLVERLLDNYMREVGISDQQFLDACTSPFAKSKTMQSVFQPILATDDFQMFRSMMVQKNMELQLQALRIIKETSGSLPDSLTDGVDEMKELEEQEISILQDVLKKSKEEYEAQKRRQLLEVETPSARSSTSHKSAAISREAQDTNFAPGQQRNSAKAKTEVNRDSSGSNNVHHTRIVNGSSATEYNPERSSAARKEVKISRLGTEKSGVLSGSSSTVTPELERNGVEDSVLPAVRTPPRCAQGGSSQPVSEACLEEAHREAGFSKPFTELSTSQQEEIQQRAAYLRLQRDKLHALKKEQQKSTPTSPEVTSNPEPTTTSNVSPEAVGQSQRNGACTPPPPPPPSAQRCNSSKKEVSAEERKVSADERKQLQKRKHLADKLKEEVIRK